MLRGSTLNCEICNNYILFISLSKMVNDRLSNIAINSVYHFHLLKIQTKAVDNYDIDKDKEDIDEEEKYRIYRDDNDFRQVVLNDKKEILGYIDYIGDITTIYLKDEYVEKYEYLFMEYAFINNIFIKKENLLMIHSIEDKSDGILFIGDLNICKAIQNELLDKCKKVKINEEDKNTDIDDNELLPNPYLEEDEKSIEVVKLKYLVFIYEGEENIISKLSKEQVYTRFLKYVSKPNSFSSDEKWKKLLNILLEKVVFLSLTCNTFKDSAKLLKKEIDKYDNR